MDTSNFKEKWLQIVRGLNERGLPMPTIRDPKTGLGSVSLTLVFLSFNFCLIAMIGKWAGKLGGIDPSQALNLFMVCAGLYWGRKFQRDANGGASIETESSAKSEESKPSENIPG
jgi:hypothetical protein